MDIKKNKAPKRQFDIKWLVAAGVVVAGAVFFVLNQSGAEAEVKRSSLVFGTVKKGDLEVVIEGFGKLESNHAQMLTAESQATVKTILLKPGAPVSQGDIILTMQNPELGQQYEHESQVLAEMQANLRQLKLNQQREWLNEQASLAETEATYEAAVLKKSVEQELVDSGIVAQLTYKESILKEKQLSKRLNIYKSRAEQLKQVHLEAVNIQLERLKQQQGKLDSAKRKLANLEVKADMDGVVQTLEVELGQSLTPGQEIARIGSVTDLVAMIKVPQSMARQVELGQKAVIDTRQHEIEGTVARIDPVVKDNSVNIEIKLPEQLPDSARVATTVDGRIIADKLTGVIYLERPSNVSANSRGVLFSLDNDGANANAKKLRYGRQAGRYIEIVSGAKIGEQYILSQLPGLAGQVERLSVK